MDIKQKLEDLPLDAIVAYMASCMRRIELTDYRPADNPGNKQVAEAIETTINIADRFSAEADFNREECRDIRSAAEKVSKILSGTAPDLARMALTVTRAISDIYCVKVEEDPNAEQIWKEAIESHTWEAARDILAEETRGTLPAREAEAEKHRRAIVMEAADNVFLIASAHVNDHLLLSDLESIIARYKTDAG
jgi:hypothetical protein